MIYVMSDIHGCYEEYMKLIKKINPTGDDTIYILGDILDKGPYPIEVWGCIIETVPALASTAARKLPIIFITSLFASCLASCFDDSMIRFSIISVSSVFLQTHGPSIILLYFPKGIFP